MVASQRSLNRSVKQNKIASALLIATLLISPWILTLAHGAEPEKLNVCYSSIAATSVSTWIPKEAGIYQKYGLDVNTVYVSGAQAISTLISGDTHIVQGSGAAAVLSRLSGADVTIIGTTINVVPMSLVTTPDIGRVEDLKGKTFG